MPPRMVSERVRAAASEERALVEKYPVPNPRVAWRTLGDEVIIVRPDDSVLYALNPTGSFIWQHATGQHTLDQIVTALCQEFDTEADSAAAEAADFVRSLCEQGLLQVTEHPQESKPDG
ncbi:MAG: PqqD family protein [Terriglobia bacterium]